MVCLVGSKHTGNVGKSRRPPSKNNVSFMKREYSIYNFAESDTDLEISDYPTKRRFMSDKVL